MAEERLNKLITERHVLIEKLNRFEEFVNNRLEEAPKPELELRLSNIKKCFTDFNRVQGVLESNNTEEAKKSTRRDFEEKYYIIVPRIQVELNQRFRSLNSSRIDINDNLQSVDLPKVELNSFAGDYSKWMNFHSSFITLVHNNPNLNDISRFQYLRNTLEGSALRTIEALELLATIEKP